MSRTRLEFEAFWQNTSSKAVGKKADVVCVTSAFGEPGLDVYIGKHLLQLSLEQVNALLDFLTANYGKEA